MIKKKEHPSFYSMFTKFSLLEDYGFTSGVISRFFRKILPVSPEKNTVEYILVNEKNGVSKVLELIDIENPKECIVEELDLSIVALCSKIVAFGLDSNIREKLILVNADAESIKKLAVQLNYPTNFTRENILQLKHSLEKVEKTIIALRKNKNKIGTSFHLTIVSRKNLECVRRAKRLLDLKLNIHSKAHWENLLLNYVKYAANKNSISKYLIRHGDLVILETVEHTAKKGEKYIAENKEECKKFFQRSLLGGAIISFFALFKMILNTYELSQLETAFYYSINYALCFILVKYFGGIVATKQPAMTASTIAKNIDKNNDLILDTDFSVLQLDRKVFSTQFVSLFGNFLMAFLFSCFIALLLRFFPVDIINQAITPQYLMKKSMPSFSLVFYAAIAGFHLAFSGLISGYFDNKVIASNISYRIRESKLFFNSDRLAKYADEKLGSLFGNISIGFLLGSTFLLSNFLPGTFDIRHIAFSSSNLGYSILNYHFNYQTILWALLGIFIIGMTNFLVSFSITLVLTLRSRGADYKSIAKVFLSTFLDFLKNTREYFKAPGGDKLEEG